MDFTAPENRPVVFFDSGIGGISVLNAARRDLPCEDFLYYADTKSAPYGNKSCKEIQKIVLKVCRYLIERYNPKAIVFACNTATAAAISCARRKFKQTCFVGIEPAVKPALREETGQVLVLGTVATLKLSKLIISFKKKKIKQLIFCPLKLLAKNIDSSLDDLNRLEPGIQELFLQYKNKVTGVVLGCTHYVFIKRQIQEALGGNVTFYESTGGTVRRLKSVLSSSGLLKEGGRGKTELETSCRNDAQMSLLSNYIEDFKEGLCAE